MRNGLVQHALRIRCPVARFSLPSKINDPFGCLVTVAFEIVQVLGHVLVIRMRGADGVAWLAVFAKDTGIGIGLEACKLFRCSRSTAI